MSTATDTVTDDAVIVMSRVYEAPRDLVWEAITQPRHVAQWWGGPGFSNPVCAMDVRKGGAWTHVMRFPDGHELHMDFVFVEVDPYGNHHTPAQVDRDRRKDLALRAENLRVNRYSGDQLAQTPDTVGADVAATLATGPKAA